MGGVADFLQARDFLRARRSDYELAYRHFNWPRLDKFNWALDYFDVTVEQPNPRKSIARIRNPFDARARACSRQFSLLNLPP